MKVSIVTTLYRSAPYLDEFYARTSAVTESMALDFDLILVNDGSPDNSLDVALALYERDKRVKIIDLSRNFGHHKAMMTGLSYADGDLVFLLDSDLEEDPEWLKPFYHELMNRDVDVVYGVQGSRRGNARERAFGEFFYICMRYLTDSPIPRNLVTARLMRRCYVHALVQHREREILIAGLWLITGFKQVPFSVVKHSHSDSTYNFVKKISIIINAITSFSNRPLIGIFYLGSVIMSLAGGAALLLILRVIFFGHILAGYASLITSIWLLGGMMIFCLGIIGIYLAKVFTETKARPYTIVRRFYAHNEEREHEI